MVKSVWREKDSATQAGSWLLIIRASSSAPEFTPSVSSFLLLPRLQSSNATADTLPRRSHDIWIHDGFEDISMFCCQPEVWIKEPTRKSEWTSLAAALQSHACTLSHLVSELRTGASSPCKERCGEADALGNSGKEKELWHPTRLKREGAKHGLRRLRSERALTPSWGSRRQTGGTAKPPAQYPTVGHPTGSETL